MAKKTDVFLKVKKEDIVFITTIIESFEGVAAVRTPNPDPKSEHSVLHCIASPDCLDQLDLIIKDLSKEYKIERVSSGESA
jgi:hypothetical protein